MYLFEHGGDGKPDPWDDHPLLVKIREQVDRYERLVERFLSLNQLMSKAGWLFLTAAVIFAAVSIFNWWIK
jgi:hypothetical protein